MDIEDTVVIAVELLAGLLLMASPFLYIWAMMVVRSFEKRLQITAYAIMLVLFVACLSIFMLYPLEE